ncbi:MAG: hypothetical protein K5874_07760 [Bacteroidaceae bacterium]|nr:hypothetical protein [Bacteroidaceae bacterium]
MKNYIKIPVCAIAFVVAGYAGVKTYQSYGVNESTLISANVEALSQDGGDGAQVGAVSLIPQALKFLVEKFGPRAYSVIKELIKYYTYEEIIEKVEEMFSESTYNGWTDTGQTQPVSKTTIDPKTGKTTIERYYKHLYMCEEIKGDKDDVCKLGETKWV